MDSTILENAVKKSQLAIAFLNAKGTITWVSEHFSTLTKINAEEDNNAGDIDIADLFFVDINCQEFKTAITAQHSQTIFCQPTRLNGLGLSIHLGELTAEHRIMVLSAHHDNAKKLIELETDALTGLLNRSVFEDFLNTPITLNGQLDYSIMLVDLDRFKQVNDTLGHPVGDKLLKLVANRFRKLLCPDDRLIRIGGDEFALIFSNKMTEDSLVSLAERIIASVSKTFILQMHQINIGASIGIAMVDDSYSNYKELYRHADLALYASKSNGGSKVSLFTTDLEVSAQYRRVIENGLRRGLVKKEFRVVYQPQVNVTSNKVVSIDAIVEWHSDELGKVDTIDFYPVAKDIGEINKITFWVFEQAFKETKTLLNTAILSFNLLGGELLATNFVACFNELLLKYKIKPTHVELIIPEQEFLDVRGREAANALSLLGILISISDSITGYESLRFLKRLPISRMWVHRKFIYASDKSSDSLEMIRTIANIGEMLGIPVVAQDVKTADELSKLKDDGCPNIEGFSPSPLLNVKQLRNFFTSHIKLLK